jgi:hypothetical protein
LQATEHAASSPRPAICKQAPAKKTLPSPLLSQRGCIATLAATREALKPIDRIACD